MHWAGGTFVLKMDVFGEGIDGRYWYKYALLRYRRQCGCKNIMGGMAKSGLEYKALPITY